MRMQPNSYMSERFESRCFYVFGLPYEQEMYETSSIMGWDSM